jgi:hypothetical protein
VVEICVAFSDGFGDIKGFFYLDKMGALQHIGTLQMGKKAKMSS